MTSSNALPPSSDAVLAALATNQACEAKLHRPPARSNWVRRDRLLAALDRAARRPVTIVTAPAGYGKTTLLAQWLAEPDRPPTAWLSLDAGDDHPERLWSHVAAALRRAGCAVPEPGDRGIAGPASGLGVAQGPGVASGPGGDRTLLPALTHALDATPDELVLVLDDFHCIREQACHDQVQYLIAHLPPQAHLVLVTRLDPGLRLGRLRASGDLTELRASDLSFTEAETVELLSAAHVSLNDDSLATLTERTEGWPAALYLATLSLANISEPDDFVSHFGGGNRFIGDYLIEEVLSRQDDRVRTFITTAALLDRFSTALCDHVGEVDDSAAILADLERSNLFVVPLDEEHRWFRFHHLFAAVARSELELEDPEAAQRLHERAAEWFRVHGHVEQAIEHLLAAGRTDDAARLVQANWLTYVDVGRHATVTGWLDTLGPETVERSLHAGLTAAWMAALAGDLSRSEHHLALLADLEDVGPLPDGTRSVGSAILLIRSTFPHVGPLDAMDAAQRAVRIEDDESSPQHAMAQLALGHAAYLLGDLERALDALRDAADSAAAPALVRARSLSLQSLVEAERGDLLTARFLAEHAMEVVEGQGLRAAPEASLALTAFGLAQAAAGKLETALASMEETLDPRRQQPGDSWTSVHHMIATAQVAAAAGRWATARELTDRVTRWLGRFPHGTEAMRVRVAQAQALLREEAAAEVLGEPLTNRERDVLRLLQSDLTPQEIAAELFLTLNTVKTHASAIYRKLGAHSRAEAVVNARRLALL